MPLAIDVGQRVLVYNPSHGWTTAYFVRAQQTNDNKLQILTCRLANCHHKPTSQDHYRYPPERVALNDNIGDQVNVGTRVLCLPSGDADTSRYIDKPLRGIIAEQPTDINDHRYLIFADSDSPFYLRSTAIRLLLEPLSNYLSKVDPGTKQYIENYVLTYPKRRLVNVSTKDHINVELNGQWIDSIVSKVDASLIRLYLPILNKHEWLYRGSLRLQPLFNSVPSYEPPCKRFASERPPIIHDDRCHFLLVPLNHGWKRQIRNDLGTIVYISPCGQMFTDPERLNSFLYQTNSSLFIRQFTFDMSCRVTQKFLSPKTAFVHLDDYASSREKVPLMLVNEVDSSLPESFEYKTDRIPLTSDIIIDRDNIRGCSCTDGCLDTTKCACWQKTYNGIIQSHYYEDLIRSLKSLFRQSIGDVNGNNNNVEGDNDDDDDDEHGHGHDADDIDDDDNDQYRLEDMRTFLYEALSKRNFGYKNGRLLEKIHSGIYECNGKCNCDSRCTNRCVQLGLNTILQIYHTAERGWGVRTMYDLPAGTFLSFYAGEILNDEDANRRGLDKSMGDVYFTGLDFITSLKQTSLQKKLRATQQNRSFVDSQNYGTSLSNGKDVDGQLDGSQVNYDSGIFVMDAHFKGNVSRFYNHSCSPNVFVQNVFLDSWDPRFPWVAFFTATHIKAGTELAWDYSYEVDTVENRVLHCRCGSVECRHRLL